jgi:quinol monooxygenase YgiN
MPFVIVKSNVKDFEAWKKVFSEDKKGRKEAGAKNLKVFTTMGKKNEVYVFSELESLEKFHAYMENPELQAKMQESGSTEPPEVFLLNHEFDE